MAKDKYRDGHRVYTDWDELLWWLGGKDRCPSEYYVGNFRGGYGLSMRYGGGLYGYIDDSLVPRLKEEGYIHE